MIVNIGNQYGMIDGSLYPTEADKLFMSVWTILLPISILSSPQTPSRDQLNHVSVGLSLSHLRYVDIKRP